MDFALLSIPILLSIVYVLSYTSQIKDRYNVELFRSFTAGFSVAYVFLILLPEANALGQLADIDPLVFMFAGFVIFHAVHQYVFRFDDHKPTYSMLDWSHALLASFYNFLLAFSVVELIRLTFHNGFLLLVLIITHTMLNEITHARLEKEELFPIKPWAVVIGIILGGVLPMVLDHSAVTTAYLFAFTTGAVMYVSIREEVPDNLHGHPTLFLLGATILVIARMFI